MNSLWADVAEGIGVAALESFADDDGAPFTAHPGPDPWSPSASPARPTLDTPHDTAALDPWPPIAPTSLPPAVACIFSGSQAAAAVLQSGHGLLWQHMLRAQEQAGASHASFLPVHATGVPRAEEVALAPPPSTEDAGSMAPSWLRYRCRYPGCNRHYASTDGVRKHCRKKVCGGSAGHAALPARLQPAFDTAPPEHHLPPCPAPPSPPSPRVCRHLGSIMLGSRAWGQASPSSRRRIGTDGRTDGQMGGRRAARPQRSTARRR